MTNLEVIVEDLLNLEKSEFHTVCDYISCPSSTECNYDGENNECCEECKFKWLYKEFDE